MAQNTSTDFTARVDALTAAVFPNSPPVPAGSVPSRVFGGANFKNLLDGGDFTVNPFQRNIPGLASSNVLSTAITNTPGYFADRWFGVGGASSAILFAKDADASVPGFSTSLRFQRQSGNANTAVITMGQVLESSDCIRCQGLPLCFSGFIYVGGNYSGGNITIQIVSGTGTDQSAASVVAGTWPGQTVVATFSQPAATSAVPFQLTGLVPTNSTQIAVLISYTPTGTAGTNDFLRVIGLQLEFGTVPTNFEHRDIQVETEICQRYAWVTAEPAAAVVVGTGSLNSTTAAIIYMATPVQMRAAPTVTVVAGTFHAAPAGAAASGTIAAGTTHTPNAITVNVTGITASTAGFGTPLVGGGGTGNIIASADY